MDLQKELIQAIMTNEKVKKQRRIVCTNIIFV